MDATPGEARAPAVAPALPRRAVAHVLCALCARPVRLRADVIVLTGGDLAVDRGALERALRVHMRNC